MSESSAVINSPENQHLEIQGSKGPIRWSFEKDSCVVRVDIPGCSGIPIEFDIHPTHVAFYSEEPAMDKTDHSRRRYKGYVKFDPNDYDLMQVKPKVVNGVLWITVPKRLC